MNILQETIKNIKPLDKVSEKKAWSKIDNLTKPIGSLGKLEEIAAKMAGITGEVFPKINKKSVIIMCADNGVVEENVSNCPQELTHIVTENFTKDVTGVYNIAKYQHSDITVVDIGVNYDFDNANIINKKIAYGTKNMTKGPAMTREEAIKAIEVGIEIVNRLVDNGVNLFGTGEMGVGNTTTSAAILSALTGISPEITAGKGSGINEEQFMCKINSIKKAIEINKPDKNDVIDVISKVGGFDIAGLCGCFLGSARRRVPIVIDGFISSAAALCAVRINKLCKSYIFPSHLSAEPASKYMMKEIGIEPYFNLNMRLGEGSGCPLTFNIIETALYTMINMGSFSKAHVDSKNFIDLRKENK